MVTDTHVKEKKVFGNFFRKKGSLEKEIIKGIEILISIIETMDQEAGENDPFLSANRILDQEAFFENHEKEFYRIIRSRHSLPVCWEEFVKIENSIRQIVNHFVTLFNKIQIFRSDESFSAFYEHEKQILRNTVNFLEEYSANRKYAYQVMINSQHELKEFMKIYFTKLNTIFSERLEQSEIRIKLLEIFEQINKTNEELQGEIGKIYIATSL